MYTKLRQYFVQTISPLNPVSARTLRNESGAALVAALLLMVAMISIIPVAMHLSASDIKRTASFAGDREAFYLAEAGLQHAGALYQNHSSNDILKGMDGDFSLTDDNGNFYDNGSTTSFIIPGSTLVSTTSKMTGATHNFTKVDFEGGTYQIRIFDNSDGALCPSICSSGNADPTYNTDNESWVDRDGLVFVESIGTAKHGETVTLAGAFKRKMIPPSFIPAAVVLVGPKASLYAFSANYDVTGASSVGGSGYDINSATDAECTGKSGVSIEAGGDPALNADLSESDPNLTSYPDLTNCEVPTAPPNQYNDVCISLPNQARAGIQGVNTNGGTNPNPNPDITLNDQTFTGDDAAKLYEDIITNGTPDIVLPNPATPADVTDWGTRENPVVIYAPGNLNTAGNNTGYGILVVDGNLSVSGILTWNGIILIGAGPTATGELQGSGSITVNGTTVIGNNDPNIRARSNFDGSAAFQYSCEGIDIANGAYKDTFEIVAWNEINK